MALTGAGCGDDGGDEAPAGGFDADRAFADLVAQVEVGQRPAGSTAGRETAELIADRLREAGAEGVTIQSPWLNVTGSIPGEGQGVVVVGAHYDTKDDVEAGFQGANDGASGVAVVLELARTLPNPAPGPAVQFALFDAEEARGDRDFLADGLRGSRQYVEYARAGGRQGSPALSKVEAMVLFDLVGDCSLQVPYEPNSDRGLYERFADAAREASGGSSAPFEGDGPGVVDDHIPFAEAGIPAVDLVDFTFGPGPSPGAYWHTPEDTLERVCASSLEAVGEPALIAIPGIR